MLKLLTVKQLNFAWANCLGPHVGFLWANPQWVAHSKPSWGPHSEKQLWAPYGLTHWGPVWVFCGQTHSGLPTENPHGGANGQICYGPRMG